MPKAVHQHRIDVETEHEEVRVTLGPKPAKKACPVAGGFTMFFNRLIDNGLWADLPDAARAVYLPLARLGDATAGGSIRSRAGLASLMRWSGLSRSSVKRGLKALQDKGLIAVVRRGGVGADGVNRPNVYELLVPEPADREGGHRRTDPVAGDDPTPRPLVDRPSGRRRPGPPSAAEPHPRGLPETPPPTPGCVEPSAEERAVELLGRWGIDSTEAAGLVAEAGPGIVSKCVADARALREAGKLRSAAGFLRWAIRERGEGDRGSGPIEPARSAASAAASSFPEMESGDDPVDGLDDAALGALAERVLAAHADRPAMVRLLTAKPPRHSKLMRAEVAALLEPGI